MTWAQWLFEYAALRSKEEEQLKYTGKMMEFSARTLRETMISTLGLNLVHTDSLKKEGVDYDEERHGTPFVPMSFLVGRPETMKELIDSYEKYETSEGALNDDDFDKFSRELQKRLESGEEGDMEPIISAAIGPDETTPEKRWASPQIQSLLRSAGVHIVDEEDTPKVSSQEAQASAELSDVIQEVAPGLFKVSASSESRKKFGVVFDEPEEIDRG